MKTTNIIVGIVLLFGIQNSIFSQTSEINEHTKFSIEIDPATFAFKGYGVHVRIQPKGSNHILLGAGTYAMDIPDILVDFNSKNKDQGWDVRINQGYSIFAEHHFTRVHHKWFIGAQVGLQEFKIQNASLPGTEKFTNTLTMGYVGYTLKPFKQTAIYIKPWAGVGYTSKLSGKHRLETRTYDIAPITMFLTLHVGYTF